MAWSINDFAGDAKRQIMTQLIKNGKGHLVQKASKMHNIPDRRGEVHFDSKKEARRFDELLVLLRAGKITDLKLQHDFTLQEAYTTIEGKRVRAIRYRADFTYWRQTEPDTYGYEHWVQVVEDVKGRRLPEYKMKAKMFRDRYGFDIMEV